MPHNDIPQRVPQRQVSAGRKQLYYLGMGLTAVGMLTFLSTFVTFLMHFGDFSNFEGQAKSFGFRGFGGMVLMMLGGFVMNLGRAGAAGSGLKLDPQQARSDLEPWSRMSGGMLSDTLDEAGINLRGLTSGSNQELPFDEKLRRLHKLKQDGILSEEEYQREKQDLLDKN